MAELTKQALKVANNTEFPNNNNGQITPTRLRTFNEDMIDSLVDEISYTADSASFNSRINSVTGSSAITASSLITASFDNGTRNLTFTKGNNTQFSVNIPDVSGSTGNFATTGSNSFVGNQTIAGGLLVSSSAAANGFSGSTFRVDTTGTITFKPGTSIDFQGNTNFTSPIRTTIVNVDNLAGGGYYGFNAETEGRIYQDFSGSVNARINAITGSGGTTNTGSLLVTASVSGTTMTFTKGDASTFDVTLPTGSGGGTIDTGSFATTGSNTFTGNQNISTAGNTQLNIISTGGGQANVEFQAPNANFQAYGDFRINNNGQYGGSGSIFVVAKDNSIAFAADRGFQFGSVNSVGSGIEGGFVTINVPSGSSQLQLTGSMLVTNNLTVSGNANVNTDLTVVGNTNVGNVNVSDAGGINFACTGSGPVTSYGMVTNPSNGDLVFNNNPGNGRLMTFAQTDARAQIYGGLYLNGVEGAGGVNMNTLSGSLFLTPSGFNFNTASLTHIIPNNIANNVNLIYKNNNNTGQTIVSGSNNIFTNPTAAAAGFVRYIGGNNNTFGNVHIPQITGSAAFSPSMNNNIINTGIVMRLPVSSSAYTMNGNIMNNPGAFGLQLGPTTGSNFERAVSGLGFNNNIVNGAITATAFKTPLSSSISISSNNIGGTVNISMDSSSISFVNNIVQGQLVVNNSYFPTTYTAASALFGYNANINIGVNSLYASGSNATFTGPPRTITNTAIIGNNNVMSASLNGDNAQINSTILLGQSLIALGTNSRPTAVTAADWGSVFVGRWNDITGTKDTTAETVFAVGTGTGAAARKTGFLIDSGSNSFFEGSLNVSGSTILSGSTFINNLQNGITDVVVTYNTTTGELRKATLPDILSASFDAGEFWSTTTQSGSAGVSGSITFNNSGSVAGISVANNSQITVSQAGTYNIQFSAQLEANAGADTVYMWFKKNGVNIPDSASKAVLANNTAQIMTVNILDIGQASDYYELAYQTLNGDATVLYEPASGNIPAIPSVILTVTQIR